MSDTNLVLEHLRAIRGQLATLQDTTQDISRRLTQVEIEVGQMRSSVQSNHGNTMLRLDGLERRMARIERRLVMDEDEFAGWEETVHLLKSTKNAERLLASVQQARLESRQSRN